ncbi:MAG: PilX N-terminal domain-containing pilus assembly protein [Candidatus Macondimonas sp.]|jgi:hypothetical protein
MSTLIVPPPRRQRGIVLMVALVMLVTITLLAIMTLGSATTEQKIAATGHFHNMGFQGAESAIEAAMTDVPHLSAALISSTPVDRTLNLGTTPVTAAARTSYLGDASNIVGYSLGGQSQFAAYHFLIQGTGTVNGVNLPAVTAQGVYRIAPATNN